MLKLPKRGGNGASQGEGGGGGEKEEKTPARKHCENDKHPLISRAFLPSPSPSSFFALTPTVRVTISTLPNLPLT